MGESHVSDASQEPRMPDPRPETLDREAIEQRRKAVLDGFAHFDTEWPEADTLIVTDIPALLAALLAAEQRAEEAERERDELREDLARTLRVHAYRIGSSRPCDCSSCANARRTLQRLAPHKAAEEAE
jgi:hypothetical protein